MLHRGQHAVANQRHRQHGLANRTNDENGYNAAMSAGTSANGLPVHPSILPPGIWNLSSDVVDIEGIPEGGGANNYNTTFAMQMSFDDGINMAMDGNQTTTLSGAYIAKWNSSANMWQAPWQYVTTPGSNAYMGGTAGFAGSLSEFLSDYYTGSNLASLVGSWGADLSNPGGVESSWVIVNSNGQFAVVPEPSTLALLGAVGGGVVLWSRRKRRLRLKA